jgi:hypothetical protein
VKRSFWAMMPLIIGATLSTPSSADDAMADPSHACDRAAERAQREWNLPAGLLAAIGVIESGRGDLGSTLPRAWPWTVNAAGRGLTLTNKEAAIAAVRASQASGVRVIDVGCFQVDLFFHPEAFASLEAAFNPETNADAAARILTRSRLSGGSWEGAIALYHSASATLGQHYLRQVQAVWPLANARSAASVQAGYVVLLSRAAEQVRIGVPWRELSEQTRTDLPRVLGPQMLSGVVQWAAEPRQDLPVVLSPVRSDAHRQSRRAN